MTQPDPNSAPALGLAAAFGGPQDSPAQNVLPSAQPNVRIPLPVVPHDTQPHRAQQAEYDRIGQKLRQFPSDHPAVASAVDALSAADFFNSRRARGVSHEWPAAHAEVLRTLEQVAAAFPNAAAPPVAAPPASDPRARSFGFGEAVAEEFRAPPVARTSAAAAPAARGTYRVELAQGKATIYRNGVRLQTNGDVEIVGQSQPQAQPQGEAPSLLWFGHPNYLEALRFVFRGRYVPASEAGIPLSHILAYTTPGRMVDTRLKADDLPRMEDEQKHVLAMLEFLVRQDFLEMNEVGGVQMLRMSKATTESIRYYAYPEKPVVAAEAPRLQLTVAEEPAAAPEEKIKDAEPLNATSAGDAS